MELPAELVDAELKVKLCTLAVETATRLLEEAEIAKRDAQQECGDLYAQFRAELNRRVAELALPAQEG